MIKEEYDLKKAWDEACDAFQKTASEDLKSKTKYTPDEVLEQIRAKQEKDEEKSAKYRVAKDILSKTLDCIDSLANIAAQGASVVCFRHRDGGVLCGQGGMVPILTIHRPLDRPYLQVTLFRS